MHLPRYRAVFVSPHLDDAVFSCGGTMARLVAEGPVLVLNVFSAYPADVHRGPIVIEQGRHAEESAAARLLGFSSDSLNKVDAALRDDAYRHPANLFRPPVAQDVQALGILSSEIRTYLAEIDYDSLYLPLGIGWHVDHVLCHAATAHLRGSARVLFYEDAPYCLVSHFTRYRLRELATVDEGLLGSATGWNQFARNWYEASRDYAGMAPLRKTQPWLLRAATTGVVSIFLWRLLMSHRNPGASNNRACRYRLGPELSDISANFSKKIDACYQYKSQIEEFFTSRQECETRYREYSDTLARATVDHVPRGAIYERFWEFLPRQS